jgi:hypothetical protein
MENRTPASERVALEAQVVYFNLNGSQGLVVSGLGKRSQELLLARDWVSKRETPAAAAVRVLTRIAGVRTAIHEPIFVSLDRNGGQGVEPVVTATFTAIGGAPFTSEEWGHFCPASRRRIEERIRRPEAVLASLEVIRNLVADDLRVAVRLTVNRDGLFTLKDLRRVLVQVTGREMDGANLRRRLEAAEGLVDVVDFDEVMQGPRPPAVKRGRRSTWYRLHDLG